MPRMPSLELHLRPRLKLRGMVGNHTSNEQRCSLRVMYALQHITDGLLDSLVLITRLGFRQS